MTDVDEVGRRARTAGKLVAVAESLTSGRIAARLGVASGASDWFAGGVVAYRTPTKQRVLGLDPGIDPCSGACAEQLAAGARDLVGADLVVSATGVGGPDAQDGHAPGTVYLGWSDDAGTGHVLLQYDGDPSEVVDATVAAAIDLIATRLHPGR